MRQRKKARRFGGPAKHPVVQPRERRYLPRAARPDWPSIAGVGILCGILFFLFFSIGVPVLTLGKVAALALVLALYFVVIALLDKRSRHMLQSRPMLRTLACGMLGVVVAFLLASLLHGGDESWLLAGAVLGALLGWLGTGWARFL